MVLDPPPSPAILCFTYILYRVFYTFGTIPCFPINRYLSELDFVKRLPAEFFCNLIRIAVRCVLVNYFHFFLNAFNGNYKLILPRKLIA